MRRKFALAFALVITMMFVLAPNGNASVVVPYQAHPHGHSYQAWMRIVGQFFLGDASNPLIAGLVDGDCGQMIDGAFVMAAPIDVGVEFNCHLRTGRPIVLSHAGFFTTEGIDGDTDADLHAAAEAGFVTTSDSLTIDGKAVRLKPIDAGVFNVTSEPGSFYDSVVGVGTGTIRTALIGNLVFVHPLTPGLHVIETEVTFVGSGGAFSATYHVHVAKGRR